MVTAKEVAKYFLLKDMIFLNFKIKIRGINHGRKKGSWI